MNRFARAACAAATTVVLASVTPAVPASTAPDRGAREVGTPTYRVAARLNTSEVVAGEHTVRVVGVVRPDAAGQKVVLQQRRQGSRRWRDSGTARIRPTGRFVLEDEPSKPGVRFYRVRKLAAHGIRAGTSRELRLDVWQWQPLTRRTARASSGVYVDAPAELGTELYDDSLVLQAPGTVGYVEYALDRKCRLLRASYALTSGSAPGASGAVTVSMDGTAVVTHSLPTGTVVRDYVTDLTWVSHVRFDMSGSASPAGTSAIGDPDVLCMP